MSAETIENKIKIRPPRTFEIIETCKITIFKIIKHTKNEIENVRKQQNSSGHADLKRTKYIYIFLNKFIYLFIYFWVRWVFISVQGLSLVVASGGHSSSRCAGLLIVTASLVAEHGLQTRRLSSCGSRA